MDRILVNLSLLEYLLNLMGNLPCLRKVNPRTAGPGGATQHVHVWKRTCVYNVFDGRREASVIT